MQLCCSAKEGGNSLEVDRVDAECGHDAVERHSSDVLGAGVAVGAGCFKDNATGGGLVLVGAAGKAGDGAEDRYEE